MNKFYLGLIIVITSTSLSYSQSCNSMPPENDFTLEVLTNDAPGNPWDIAIAPDGKVYWVGRAGHFAVYDPATNNTTQIHRFDVLWEQNDNRVNFAGAIESGLQGIALDPNFETTRWVYFWHSLPPSELPNFQEREMGPIERLSRYTLTTNRIGIDLTSEKIIYQHSINAQCCHYGGDLDLGPDGNLWASTGDNRLYWDNTTKNPFKDAEEYHDVRKTSSNTNDPRGKVLRISPISFPDSASPLPGLGSTYNIPTGNMWDVYGPSGSGLWEASEKDKVLPEVYSMGHRNPVSMTIRPGDLWLSTGEAAGDDNGYEAGGDEINVLTKPASAGWPFFNLHNMPYHQANLGSLQQLDPNNVLNLSPHNNGTQKLPPNIAAAVSTKGPGITHNLNCFGVTLGWVDFNPSLNSNVKFPSYLHNKLLFTGSWGSGDIFALTVDATGVAVSKERFFSSGNDIISAEMGPDGALYMAIGASGEWGAFNGSIKKLSYNGSCAPYVPIAKKNIPHIIQRRIFTSYSDRKIQIPVGTSKIEVYNLAGIKIFEVITSPKESSFVILPEHFSTGIKHIRLTKNFELN